MIHLYISSLLLFVICLIVSLGKQEITATELLSSSLLTWESTTS